MSKANKITGKQTFDILELALKNRTILHMTIIDTSYECLTILTGKDTKNHVLMIDFPGIDRETVLESLGKKVNFEFSGEDKIQYSFMSEIVKVNEADILIKIPIEVERIQRRKYFRVAAPPGTMLILDTTEKRYEFNVINLSEGGALLNQKAHSHDKRFLHIGGEISNINLIYHEDNHNVRIGIKKADILRVERKTEIGRYNYALRFLEVDKKAEEQIREFIYMCQRRALKKRSYT